MPAIQAIIFDWGGVLIDDPAPLLLSVFSRTLGVSADAFAAVIKRHGEPFQKGLCGEADFWRMMCADLGVPTPGMPSLWGAAFREVYRPKPRVWALARRLSQGGYRTALLSNTEAPGVAFFRAAQPHCFDALVFSCCEHCRKPERRIYELACGKLGCAPEQAVFIDDNEQYVQGAREAGLRGIRFVCPRAMERDLEALGVNVAIPAGSV